MSLALTGDTIAYLMELGLSAEQMKGLIERLHRDAMAMTPPTVINGVNEERERLRNESTYAERKRKRDRERRQAERDALRAQNGVATADDRPATAQRPPTTADDREGLSGDRPHTGARVVLAFSSSLRSEEVGGGGVEHADAISIPPPDDWPDGKASDHADLLVQAVASPWLDPAKSPELVTTRGRVAAWKRAGASWDHDVVPVVTGLCANRRSRVASWKFFDEAISRSIAENRAALEIPEALPRRNATGPPSWAAEQAAINAEARRRVLEGD